MNTYETGIHTIDIKDYHESKGISRSGIMLFKRSPLHYWNRYNNPDRVFEDEMTPCKLIGNVFHTLILESHEFDRRYYIEEKVDRRTTAGKERAEQLAIENKDKSMLSQINYDKIRRMYDSFMSHEIAKEFLNKARMEKSVYWKDVNTNVLCKARPDIWHTNMICDIKTTKDASLSAFQRSLATYGYHIQAAMIQDGIQHVQHHRITDYIFIAIESVEPYAIGIYILDKDSIERGMLEYKQILVDYKEYLGKDIKVWQGYKPSIISLPAYYN
jgi:hypothetical protein